MQAGNVYREMVWGMICLLSAAALVAQVYIPSRNERVRVVQSLQEARGRVRRLHARIRRLQQHRRELEARVPVAVEDAIRADLRMDRPGAYFMTEDTQPE